LRALILDSQPIYRTGLAAVLRDLDPSAEIEEATHIDAALDRATTKPAPDVIIAAETDPGPADGEAIGRLCAAAPDAAVVAVRSSCSTGSARAILDAGGMGVLLRSTPAKVVQSAVRLVISGGTFVPPAALTESVEPHQARRRSHRAATPGVPLTPRQMDVLELLSTGKQNKQIAKDLDLAEGTVKVHISAIFKVLGASNRTEAMLKGRSFLAQEASANKVKVNGAD
jgi:DNA-binding NarL/FixJ family response regulator